MVVIAKKLEAKGKKIYYFNTGDPNKFDFDTPAYLKEELIKAVRGRAGFYSDSQGNLTLIESIVKRENKKNNINLNNTDVLITQGISEALMFIFGAIIEQGKEDEILVPGPSYPPYLQWIKFFSGKPIAYRLIEEENWKPDVDDLRKKITKKTTTVVIINPNNPTGSVADKSVLKEMINLAGEYNLTVMADEIYDQLIFGKTQHYGVCSIAEDIPVIGVNGFSKAYLIPGWRLGYIYFRDKSNELNELKEAVFSEARQRLSACTPIMKACAVAYSGPQDHIKETNEKLRKRAEFAFNRLNEIDGITTQKPEGAFYIFPKVDIDGKWKDDREFCLDVLENTGIIFPYGSGFHEIYGKDHFRSVILPPIELMEEAFSKLEDFMKKMLRKL
jgi:aspartate/methionine/tyrosine aminotransferase